MKTLCKYKKRYILHSYLLKLPKPLGQAFGKSDFYTPAQVRVCLIQAKLNASYAYYAYAIFCEQADFDAYMQSQYQHSSAKLDNRLSYEALRQEIGDKFFHGNSSFRMQHIERLDPRNSALPPGIEINENVNA